VGNGGARLEDTGIAGTGDAVAGDTGGLSGETHRSARTGAGVGPSLDTLAAAQSAQWLSWCGSTMCAHTATDVLNRSRISAKAICRTNVRTMDTALHDKGVDRVRPTPLLNPTSYFCTGAGAACGCACC
jgi:hypothetical protein